jgi:hypothetical protein
MPAGSTALFNNVDPQGNPTNPIVNQLVNFGWEYVYHCHILTHEEMDMMRPVSVVLPPISPDGLAYAISGSGNNAHVVLTWNDNSITETAFVIQSMDWTGKWTDVGSVLSPLNQANTHGSRSYTVPGTYNPNAGYRYRVAAQNTVGYGSGFPTMTAQSISSPVTVGTVPLAPTNLMATLQAGPKVVLTWRDNAVNESGFVIERSTDGTSFARIATAPARNNTGNVTFTDTTLVPSTTNVTYTYRVAASNPAGTSAYSTPAAVAVPVNAAPAAPANLSATLIAGPQIRLTWTDTATNESGFVIQRSNDGTNFTQIATAPALSATGAVTFTDATVTTSVANVTYTYRVAATNGAGTSAFSNTASVLIPALPAAPTNFTAVNGANANRKRSVVLNWIDNSSNETGFTIQMATNSLFTLGLTTINVGPGVQTYTQTSLNPSTQYWFRIRANNGAIISTVWVNATPFPIRTNP